MLAPYIICIVIVLSLTCGLNVVFTDISFWMSFLITNANFLLIIIVDSLIAWSIHSIPMKHFSPYKRIYKIYNFEHKFYEKTGIKKWKGYVAELGGIGKFRKNKINSEDPSYLLRFLQESCCGELIHWVCILAGVVLLIFLKWGYFLNFSLGILIANTILNLLPIWIQRYNRPRMIKIYEWKSKRNQK